MIIDILMLVGLGFACLTLLRIYGVLCSIDMQMGIRHDD